MQTRYKDLVYQTFEFPQEEFKLKDDHLLFHDLDLMQLIKEYGTPFKFTYLPQIGSNIERAKTWFDKAIQHHNYKGDYHYCYCTKSSHFAYVIEEALKNNVHLETSSSYDISIIQKLFEKGKMDKKHYVLCNGYKDDRYINNIVSLLDQGFENVIVIIDSVSELSKIQAKTKKKIKVGIRIASEEDPKFPFYTSRLGIGYKSIVKFYKEQIKDNPNCELKMLHFFINTGITDSAYYWNELTKCLKVYCELKKVCRTLEHLDIGGGFPIKNSLAFEFDYEYMVDEIINQIKMACDESDVDVPNIFTEFGSFTVGESGGVIYQVLSQKKQNDREKWNMIDSSFITTLPDSWAINKRFVMLPINRWNDKYERVLLGGLTCDSDDYYNSEQHVNAIYLPEYDAEKPLYIGFFNTGAYQDSIGGYGGIHHCLIPQPKHLIIDEDHNVTVFSQEQLPEQMLSLLGY
ncbi:MAG: arginine decarboxylase [Crocinitomicaceae bacterium]|nr:arginine decarboxylase [Crocinitomicaceae bacterium]